MLIFTTCTSCGYALTTQTLPKVGGGGAGGANQSQA